MGWDQMSGRQKNQPKQPGGSEEGEGHEREKEDRRLGWTGDEDGVN